MSTNHVCAQGRGWPGPEDCPVKGSAPAIANRPTGVEPDTCGTLSADEAPPAVSLLPMLPLPALAAAWAASPFELPRIAGYETLRVLGRGGMGIVYLARQTGLARLVALKMVLAGAHAGPEHRARFRTEAEAAARLQHPHIVQIFEIGEADGQPFLSMEYVEGGSLSAQLDGKPQPWQSAASLIEPLAGAVHHAHQRGIVHRDLKPGNILIQIKDEKKLLPKPSGHDLPFSLQLSSLLLPKITDFGIAKVVGCEAQTPSGAILGTPGYMAPEQLGASEAVGPAADIHALGAILYELLTGQPPFQADSMLETLEQIRLQEPVSPGRLVATIPLDLETICLKCLHKEPGRRYESALALADDLRRCLAGEPIRARPVSVPERSVRWLRRNPAKAALLAVSCLAALALTGVAVGLFYSARLKALNDDLEVEVIRAETLQMEAEQQRAAIGKMERWVRYLRDLHLADEAWQNGQVRRISALLGGCPKDLRGWEWYYLRGLASKDGRSLQHPAGVFSVVYDSSGWRLASGCQDGSVWIWDVASETGHAVSGHHTGSVWCVAFSPNGRLLASAGDDRRVRLWDPDSGRLVRTLSRHGAPLRCLAFSPDGKTLAAAGKEGTIKLWDPEIGCELRVLSGHPGGVLSLAFACDGRWLASGGADRTVRLWDPDSGAELRSLPGHTEEVHGVAFSPDGTVLASTGAEGTVRTWDASNGKPLTSYYSPQKTAFLGVAFGRDGRLAAASEARLVYLWDERILHIFRGHNHRIQGVAFSSDGRRLASASLDWTVKLWEVKKDQEARVLSVQSDRVLGAAFRSDGRCLTDVALNGSVRLWDVKNAQLLQRWEADLERPRSVAFSMDGRLLSAAGRKGTIRCYDLATRAIYRTWQHGAPARAVAFSPDGRRLASAGDDGTVKVWDLARDSLLFTAKGHTGPVRAVAFSPDGRTLASGSLDGVRLWDAASGQACAPHVLETPRVVALGFGPDGRLAVAQMGGNVTLWDPGSGQNRATLVGHSAMVWSLAFTPDGTRLATASRDMTVKLWDTVSGKEVLTLRGFTSELSGVAFSPDASCLATTDQGGSVRLWDAPRPSK